VYFEGSNRKVRKRITKGRICPCGGRSGRKTIIEDKKSEWNSMSILEHYQMYIDEGLSRKEAMKKLRRTEG